VLQEVTGFFFTLAQLVAFIGQLRTRFFNKAVFHTQVNNGRLAGDSFPVHNVRLSDLKRRRNLILNDLDARTVTYRSFTVLSYLNAANVAAYRSIELQCLTSSGGFGRAKRNADLFAQLVNKDGGGTRVIQRTGHLTQSLRHQASLETHVRVTHLTFDFCFRRQCSDRVNDDNIDSP